MPDTGESDHRDLWEEPRPDIIEAIYGDEPCPVDHRVWSASFGWGEVRFLVNVEPIPSVPDRLSMVAYRIDPERGQVPTCYADLIPADVNLRDERAAVLAMVERVAGSPEVGRYAGVGVKVVGPLPLSL